MDNNYHKHQAAIIAASYGITAPVAAEAVVTTTETVTTAEVVLEKSEQAEVTIVDETKVDENLEKSEGETKDSIEKGEIASALLNDYGNANATFKFEKTGKELKEILPKTIAALSLKRDLVLTQLVGLQGAIGFDPVEKNVSYTFPTVEVLMYPYSVTSRAYNELTEKYEAATDIQISCEKYNDLAYRLRSILDDIEACQVIVDNVKDTDKYKLSVSQLVAINLV